MSTVSAIVYTSNTGFTRRYAEMLAQKTGLPACDLKGPAPARGTAVVYLGWLRAGNVKGLGKARRRYDVKAVGVVGMAAEPNGKVLEDQTIPAFYLRGGLALDKLKGLYKRMMASMGGMVRKAPAKTDAEREMQEAFVNGGDWVDEAYLEPMVEFLKG